MAYKNQHNSTSVPQDYKEIAYKNKLLSVERINYLESIGFVWKFCDLIPWMEMYERLVAYKQRFQSTQVPVNYTEEQRSNYSKRELLEKRIELLNSIDFVWSAKKMM